jgi:endo-1,4-beta-D-glucanase Y
MKIITVLGFLIVFLLSACSTNDSDSESENSLGSCSDGIDNDANGFTDCEEASCVEGGFCTEATLDKCMDNTDNDGDGYVDCADSDCYCLEGDCAIAEPCLETAADFIVNPQPAYLGVTPKVVNKNRIWEIYQSWLANHYEESGDLARVKFGGNPAQTVSEGIAYGMLITASLERDDGFNQSRFDKFWAYYNSFLNSNGLMHWKINGFESVAQRNAATDAELDAAIALLLAHKKWGDQKYYDDAMALIQKIREYEVDSALRLKPGDMWGGVFNPSYFSAGAMEVFAKVHPTGEWTESIQVNYDLIGRCWNSNTGLYPDWCLDDGSDPQSDWQKYIFSFDAVRTPWRIAWHYLWTGDARAAAMNNTTAAWARSVSGDDPLKLGSDYSLSGNAAGRTPSTIFLGAFCLAGTSDENNRDWVERCYKELEVRTDNGYFTQSLQLIYLLLLSGQTPMPVY